MCLIHVCRGLIFIIMTLSAACQEREDAVLSYKGNEFYIGFTETITSGVGYRHYLTLYVSTSETLAVNFTVSSLIGLNNTYSVMPRETLTVELPYGQLAVLSTEKFTSKGIRIKVEGNKTVAVYAFNSFTFEIEGYLALPCNRLPIDEYRYYALTYFKADGYTSNVPDFILVVGCEDSTKVTTVLETVQLNKQETYLIDPTNDLSGTMVVSDKPIFFLAGNLGFRASNAVAYNNHFCEQIPPTATWGSFFLVADMPGYENVLGRQFGAKLRILSELSSTTVFVHCNIGPIQGDQYSFDTPGQYHEIDLKPDSYCTMESNKPVLVMQYSPPYNNFYMTILPSTDHYCNHYVLYLVSVHSWVTLYVTPLHYQKNSIYVDTTIVQTAWTNIYCHNNTLCGHFTKVSVATGTHSIFHTAKNAKIGVIVNGNYLAYPGGLCVVSVQRPAVSSRTHDIQPSKTSFPTSSLMPTTGFSGKSSTHCHQSSSTQVLPTSTITIMHSEIPTNVTCKPETTSTTTPTLASKSSKILTSIAVIQTATASISISVSSTPAALPPKPFPITIVSACVGVTVPLIAVTVIVLALFRRHYHRMRDGAVEYSLLNVATAHPTTTIHDNAPKAETITEDGIPVSEGSKLLQCLCSCKEPEQRHHEVDPETSVEATEYPIPTRPDTPVAENEPVSEGAGNTEGTGGNSCGSEAAAPLTYKPSLPELLSFPGQRAKINIPQEISTHSQTFGILLLKDCSGARIRAIFECSRGNPVKMNMDILEEWLEGRGMQPVTWETLVKVLRETNLATLASEIEAVKCS